MNELVLDLPGGKLAARVWGPEEGRPVLALHGWLDNAASFDGLAPLLPDFRVVAVDLPGHGHSDPRPPGATYHFVDWIADLFGAADALGWRRFSFLGHSMGAAIGCLAAGAVAERIERLVLLEGFGPEVHADHQVAERVGEYVAQHRGVTNEAAAPFATREAAVSLVMRLMPTINQRAAQTLVDRGTRAVPGGFAWRSDPRLRTRSPIWFTEAQVQTFLRRIRCPALFIRASRGYPFEPAMIAERQACVSNLRVVEVEGGHHVHLDEPALVADVVLSFLRTAT